MSRDIDDVKRATHDVDEVGVSAGVLQDGPDQVALFQTDAQVERDALQLKQTTMAK